MAGQHAQARHVGDFYRAGGTASDADGKTPPCQRFQVSGLMLPTTCPTEANREVRYWPITATPFRTFLVPHQHQHEYRGPTKILFAGALALVALATTAQVAIKYKHLRRVTPGEVEGIFTT